MLRVCKSFFSTKRSLDCQWTSWPSYTIVKTPKNHVAYWMTYYWKTPWLKKHTLPIGISVTCLINFKVNWIKANTWWLKILLFYNSPMCTLENVIIYKFYMFISAILKVIYNYIFMSRCCLKKVYFSFTYRCGYLQSQGNDKFSFNVIFLFLLSWNSHIIPIPF